MAEVQQKHIKIWNKAYMCKQSLYV